MNVEELQEELLKLKENNVLLKKDLESSKNLVIEKEERIKSLEEHNQKLFLRATATKENRIEKEENYNSSLLGDYYNLLDEEEKEFIMEIEEVL